VIVFQHGYTGSSLSWRNTLPYFTPHYACVLVDGRGCGLSDRTCRPESYTIEQYAEDVVSVVNHVGVRTFTYVGHSMGGAIGFILGLGPHKGRLDNLVFLTPVPSKGVQDPHDVSPPLPHPLDAPGVGPHISCTFFLLFPRCAAGPGGGVCGEKADDSGGAR